MLRTGDLVEVLSGSEIRATLDADGCLEGLPFMPEMTAECGRLHRVATRAERVCVFPPQVPFRRLEHAVVLDGLRCDGSAHGGCGLGCMLLWREAWLRKAPPTAARLDGSAGPPGLPAVDPDATFTCAPVRRTGTDRYVCQATELPVATYEGQSIWAPWQYVQLMRSGVMTPRVLASLITRMARRRLSRVLERPNARSSTAAGDVVPLAPGERVRIRSRREIRAMLDRHGRHRGLPFGGDMVDECGRTYTVARRLETIVKEDTGELRSLRDTVILDGAACDGYLGCARRMPFLWREQWLERVPDTASLADARPSSPRSGSGILADGALPVASALRVKRGIDVVGAIAGLTLLGPLMAWTALALLLTQGRPILFRHVRPGLHEQPFTLLKFRTMRSPRADEVWYLTDEQRLTRLGRVLRSTSIDELPELWNVLRGEMSLVGPRPLLMEYLSTYTFAERRRHNMRPGITSWAAVNGRHTLKYRERLALDIWYVDHWSLWLDLQIVVRTAWQVLLRRDVAATQDSLHLGFPLPELAGGTHADGIQQTADLSLEDGLCELGHRGAVR